MAGASPSSAGSSSWGVRSVRDGVNGRERRPNRWRKKAFINKTNEQTKTTP